MGSQFDSGKDSRRTISTANNTQCSSLFRSKSHQDSHQQYGKDTQLCRSAKDRKAQVAQHRTKVCQSTYTHKDNRRKETCLYQHIVDEVHQSQVVCNLVQRHFPDVLQCSVYHYHAVLVGLDHTHITTGKVGQQHPESNRDKQQRLILFLDTQVKQDERNGIHYQELRFSNNIAEGSHIIKSFKYIFHYTIFINTSSSETESPELAQMAVIVPPNSARMAL